MNDSDVVSRLTGSSMRSANCILRLFYVRLLIGNAHVLAPLDSFVISRDLGLLDHARDPYRLLVEL